MTDQGYAFDNANAQAGDHHRALADLLDAETRAHIEDLIDLPGKRCLEVAAGAGSIASWLAEHAAEVLATDIAPQHIPARPRLTVRQHDIVTGEHLGRFDLVHARLLLGHLPQRLDALRQMVAAVAPGGVLLTEDFTTGPGTFVSYAPDPVTTGALSRYMEAHLEVLAAHGSDRQWGHRAPAAFAEAGLTDVRLRVHGGSWHGGDPGCRLLLASLPQLRDGLLARGLTDDDLALAAEALMDPRVILSGFLTLQTSGRVA
ncbi:methyltransferase domain-containing protein [Actinoplanes sp. NBRC 103695]|uniref:methyltransferase domain-containing protein n=1 Tax=Actinoplanes sp. NBRC 103695 TaxID=3032202 RepID=UPI002552CE92|nr:methyltransferase domain-containing protein [Actinoplanes sp. NBRC 103695]